MSPRHTVEFLALAAIWGGSFLFMRVAAPELGPVPLMLVRCAIGALTLLPVLLYHGRGGELVANAGALFVVGVLNSAVPFVLLGYATLVLSAGVTSILNSLAPLWTAVIAFAWFGERLTSVRLAGLGLGIVGVAILVGGESAVTVRPDEADLATRLLPFAAGIAATVFYGIGANWARRFLVGVHPLATATGSQLAASAALLVPGLLLWPEPSAAPSGGIWLAALALGVLCTGVAYLLFFRLIANVGATRTLAVTFVIPLFGVGWGAWFLGERIDAVSAFGAVVVVVGTALATGALGGARPAAAAVVAASDTTAASGDVPASSEALRTADRGRWSRRPRRRRRG